MSLQWMLLPPAPDLCQVCAVVHEPDEPHNAQSLYYQLAFHQEQGRWPTWEDALAHCTPELRRLWHQQLAIAASEPREVAP